MLKQRELPSTDGQIKLISQLVSRPDANLRPIFKQGMQFRINLPETVHRTGPTKSQVNNTVAYQVRVVGVGQLSAASTNLMVVIVLLQDAPGAQWLGPVNLMASRMPAPACYSFGDDYVLVASVLQAHLKDTHTTPSETLSRRFQYAPLFSSSSIEVGSDVNMDDDDYDAGIDTLPSSTPTRNPLTRPWTTASPFPHRTT